MPPLRRYDESDGLWKRRVKVYDRKSRARSLILKRGGTKPCDPIQVTEICGAGHHTRAVYACTKRSCTGKSCRRHALKQRQELLRPLMLDAFKGRWGVFVLTYAPELRPVVGRPVTLRAGRAAAAAMLTEYLLEREGLDPKRWRLGVVSVEHPEGDKQPGTWKPHHNFLLPLVAFGPHGARHVLRFHFEKNELSELRARWRWVQEIALGAGLGRSADVWYRFLSGAKGPHGKLHQLNYVPRTFPDWPATGQRLTWLGAFGCQIVQRLPEVAKLKLQNLEQNQGCGVKSCGEAIVAVVADSPLPTAYRRLNHGPAG